MRKAHYLLFVMPNGDSLTPYVSVFVDGKQKDCTEFPSYWQAKLYIENSYTSRLKKAEFSRLDKYTEKTQDIDI